MIHLHFLSRIKNPIKKYDSSRINKSCSDPSVLRNPTPPKNVDSLRFQLQDRLRSPGGHPGLACWNKLHMKTSAYVAVICTTTCGTEQIRAFFEQLWSISLNWRCSKWCTYCKRRYAAVLAHPVLPNQKTHDLKKVTSPSVWLGVRRTSKI